MALTKASPLQARFLAAQAWADVFELLDFQLSPLGLRAIDALSPQPDEIILDIGCGAGQTILQIANMVGPTGLVIGVDIAGSLLDLGRRRTEGLQQVRFVEHDAAVLDLPEDSVDGVFSRFGVMSFTDPAAAFSNFHRMLKPSGRLAFVCWRALEENELDFLPLRAAGLESMIDRTPFSFADASYVRTILETAGFDDVTIEAHNAIVSSGDLEAMVSVLLKVGPLGRIVRENPDLSKSAETSVRAALALRADPSHVALNAATWVVAARA